MPTQALEEIRALAGDGGDRCVHDVSFARGFVPCENYVRSYCGQKRSSLENDQEKTPGTHR